MKDINRILVPTDYSEAAASALEYATRLAGALQAELVLLHVCPTFDYTLGVDISTMAPTLPEKMLATATRELNKIAARMPDEVVVHTLAVEGNTAGKIVDEARGQDADLVVMATHGRSGLGRELLGVVAEKVLRLSPVPVLTIRPGTT